MSCLLAAREGYETKLSDVFEVVFGACAVSGRVADRVSIGMAEAI